MFSNHFNINIYYYRHGCVGLDGEVLLILQLDGDVKELAEEYNEYTENHIVHHYGVVGDHWGGCPEFALQQGADDDGCSNAIYAE